MRHIVKRNLKKSWSIIRTVWQASLSATRGLCPWERKRGDFISQAYQPESI